MSNITYNLNRLGTGDPAAIEELLPLVYNELPKLTAVKMAQALGISLSTTKSDWTYAKTWLCGQLRDAIERD